LAKVKNATALTRSIAAIADAWLGRLVNTFVVIEMFDS
jgi:hypothetical protein